uniref:Uncharacterized protein n=1 Tax=Plectus sambesii TaxID=2011161 RepID=A0A914XB19_9BILA
MNKSWTNGESWKRPPASNELTSLITRSIANTIRAVSPAGPSWQPLPSKTPIIGTSVKSETWRSAGVAGESWRSFERGSKSETWRRGERRERGSGVSDRRKESEDRHARSRERSRSPPPRRRREHIGRKSSRWQPLSREEEEQRERAARKSSFDRRTTNMEGREVEGREEEESADDAADKLEPTCASTVDDAWEARLNAALERDVKCSLKSQTELDECQNPLHDDDFQNSLQIDDFQGAMSSLAPVQMPNDLIDLDYKLQPECHDEQPSRSLPGLKFRGAKRLIVSAFKLSTNDVRQYYCDEKFKSILANPPTLALSRLTCEELDEWKAEFPASLPVFKKRRGRTTASRIGRSVAASNQHKSRPSQKTARNSTENKQRSLNVDDCFDDDGDDDHTLSNGHQDDAKASVDGNQQKSLLKRPLARRRVPPPPREELPPGLDFLTPTQALPSFKIKKKVVVKEEKVEKKGRKYWRGSREEGRGRMMREHSREHSRDLSKEKPKIAKPLEGSVVDRAHDKKLVDSFFDRNLGHYRQAVRPKVKPPAAKIPDASVQKKESSWSKRENVKKVSEWLSRKPSGDRGPATPPGSGPDDESPAGAHLNYDVNLPAGTGVVDELLRKPLSKEEPLLAPNINPLDYVEELSNPGDDTDAIERQQFTDEAAIAEPSSSFVWTGTDDGGEERSASNKVGIFLEVQ